MIVNHIDKINFKIKMNSFWGMMLKKVSYKYKLAIITMKEHLEANLLTKHLAGWCNEEEEAYLKKWLTQNPQHQMTLAVIRQQFAIATLNANLKY